MKKRLGVIALSVLLLGGCTKQLGMNKTAVGFAISTQNNPFFVKLIEGAKQEASAQGIKLTIADAGDDAGKQSRDIRDFISKKMRVIIVNPVDSSAVASAVAAAKKAGIAVVSVDRAVIGESVACQIASDNVEGAKMAGEYLLKLLGPAADIAELQGIPGSSAAIDRGKGFHEAVDGKANVVASLTANFNRAEGMAATQSILRENPNIKGIFAHNDEMALGALEAASAAGKNIAIIGFDATDDALAALKDGRMAATVAQLPSTMGKTAVQTAAKLVKGESVASSIPVRVMLVTK